MSVAALVRYPEDNSQKLVFESSLVPTPRHAHHADLYEIRAEGIGIVARSPSWPEAMQWGAREGRRHWEFSVSGVPYRGLQLTKVPILDREEGWAGAPSTLTVVYAVPTVEMREQVWAAGAYIALASAVLLGVTVLLSLWGVRRGLLPLRHLAAQAEQVSAQHWEFQAPPDAELVAELRPLTHAMQTMLERLQQSFMQQREFLGNAAHELKTPVAILKSTIQSLLQKPRTSPEYQTGLAQALEDLERLEKLLRWMLRLARAEQWSYGTLSRSLEPIDVAGTCEGAIEGLRGLAVAHNTRIQLTTNGSVVCRADPEDLELVWVNLLENAIRYSPEGATVRVKVSKEGSDRAQVVVEDEGPGIAPEELAHIFERFHRGDPSRARETGGFGLGLAIAKALVETYGGSITPESTVGQGTRMIVRLPLSLNQ